MNRIRKLCGALLLCIPIIPVEAQPESRISVTVMPAYAWFTEASPHGEFYIVNSGTHPAEVYLTVDEGVVGSPPSGESAGIMLGDTDPLMDLSQHITAFPTRLIIEGGERKLVRYLVNDAENLPPGGYMALTRWRVKPRTLVGEVDAVPAGSGLRLEWILVAPVVMIAGEGTPVVRAEVLSTTEDAAHVLLHNDGPFPWAGLVELRSEDGEQLYDQVPTMLYTRRRVEFELPEDRPSRALLVFVEEYEKVPEHVRNRLGPIEPVIITL